MRYQKHYQANYHKSQRARRKQKKNKLLRVKEQSKYKGVHGNFKTIQQRAEFMRTFPTHAEYCLSTTLKHYKIQFIHQYIYKRMIIDFYLPKYNLLIEVDGASHYNTADKDRKRDAYLKSQGFKTLRLSNSEVLHDTVRCMKMITSPETRA